MTAAGSTLERPVRTTALRARPTRTEPLRAEPLRSESAPAEGQPTAERVARVSGSRSWRVWAGWMVMVLGLLLWSATLRPVAMGGPATFIGVDGISMQPTFYEGDLVITRERRTYAVGDVIAYRIPRGAPGEGHNIIHRIVGGSGRTGYVTRGDNNSYTDVWRPVDTDVIGKVWVKLPDVARWAGHLRSPGTLAAVVGVVTFLLLVAPDRRRRRDDDVGPGGEGLASAGGAG